MSGRRVLAAVDTSAAARPVLDVAVELARVVEAEVDAVHVRSDPSATPAATAEWAGTGLRMLEPPVDEALLSAAADPGVVLAVIGARGTPVGRRPVGGTALRLVQSLGKPVTVVPPEAEGSRPLRRLVVPLEGTETSSVPVMEALESLILAPVTVVAMHVFTGATVPRMMDRPVRDMRMIESEFKARHLPTASRVEFRTGPVDARVVEICSDEDADLVVLSWSQDTSGGRAAVVRGVLGRCRVPVLLLPVSSGPPGAGEPPAQPGRGRTRSTSRAGMSGTAST